MLAWDQHRRREEFSQPNIDTKFPVRIPVRLRERRTQVQRSFDSAVRTASGSDGSAQDDKGKEMAPGDIPCPPDDESGGNSSNTLGVRLRRSNRTRFGGASLGRHGLAVRSGGLNCRSLGFARDDMIGGLRVATRVRCGSSSWVREWCIKCGSPSIPLRQAL